MNNKIKNNRSIKFRSFAIFGTLSVVSTAFILSSCEYKVDEATDKNPSDKENGKTNGFLPKGEVKKENSPNVFSNQNTKGADSVKDLVLALENVLMNMEFKNSKNNAKASEYLSLLNLFISRSNSTDNLGRYIEIDELFSTITNPSANYESVLKNFNIKIYENNLDSVANDDEGTLTLKVEAAPRYTIFFGSKNTENETLDLILKISNFKKPFTIWDQKFSYSEKSFIGDLENSYLEKETGLVKNIQNNDLIKPHEIGKLHKAYLGAANSYFLSEEEARKSFLQGYKARVKYSFDIKNGQNLNTQELSRFWNSAEEAKKTKFISEYNENKIVYYEVKFNGKKYKINPLNDEDVEKFKLLLISNVSEANGASGFKLLLKTNDRKLKGIEDSYSYLKDNTTKTTNKYREYFDSLSSETAKKYNFGVNLRIGDESIASKDKSGFENQKLDKFFELESTGEQNWTNFEEFSNNLNKLENVHSFSQIFDQYFEEEPWHDSAYSLDEQLKTREEYLQKQEELMKQEFQRTNYIQWLNLYRKHHQKIKNTSWKTKKTFLGQNIKIKYKNNLDFNTTSKDANSKNHFNNPENFRYFFKFGESGALGHFGEGTFVNPSSPLNMDEFYITNRLLPLHRANENFEWSRLVRFINQNSDKIKGYGSAGMYGGSRADRITLALNNFNRMNDFIHGHSERWLLSKMKGRNALGLWNTGRIAKENRRVWLKGQLKIKLNDNILNLENISEAEKIIYKNFGLNDSGTAVDVNSEQYNKFLKEIAYKNQTDDEIQSLKQNESLQKPILDNYFKFARAKAALHIELLKKSREHLKLGHVDKTNYVNFKNTYSKLFEEDTENEFEYDKNLIYDPQKIHDSIQNERIQVVLTYNGASAFIVNKKIFENLKNNLGNRLEEKIQSSFYKTFTKEEIKQYVKNISNNVFAVEREGKKIEIIDLSETNVKISNNKLLSSEESWEFNTNLDFQLSNNDEIYESKRLDKVNERIAFLVNNQNKPKNNEMIKNYLILFDESLNNLYAKGGAYLSSSNNNSLFDISLSDVGKADSVNFYATYVAKKFISERIMENFGNPKKITYFLDEKTNEAIGVYISSNIYENNNENISESNAINSVDSVKEVTDLVFYKETESSEPTLIKNLVFSIIEVVLEDGTKLYFDSIDKMNKYIEK